MTAISAQRLAKTFVEVADTLVADFDLIEFLQMLTRRTADLVGAEAVGLLLIDPRGRLEFMAGSDENVRLVELFQLQTKEGPCLEAHHTGRAVINADLQEATARWPRFAPRAVEAGFQSVHAFPLRLRNEVIGALNVFGNSKGGDIAAADVPLIQSLADVAAIGLLQERAVRHGEVMTEQLQGALNSRIAIEQAKGAVSQAMDITVDEAFTLIRTFARSHNRKLTEVAHAVVTDQHTLDQLSNG